ncbi:MAG: DUF3375 domain-containing protein [Anaerolinea sp.]|nr:DUF3375 domain-containing protein [Anaerolinea sp.]
MDFAQIKSDLENSPSLKLLRQQHAPLIVSFFYEQFKQQQRVTVPYDELLGNLDAMLDRLNEQQPGSFPRSAKEYLDAWSKELRLLRIYAGTENAWMVDLTSETERVIRWFEELRQRPFVGTESRFRSIFETLREIIANSTEDPEQRMLFLRAQQAALQREIDAIETTGRVQRYNETQIRERFLQVNENAVRLLSDFAAVEQNFRDLARKTQEATLRPNVQRGVVLGDVLDADEALESSDEGRSFRAFWQYLLIPAQKDELAELIRAIHALPELAALRDSSILPSLTRRLLDAGQKVIASNQQLSEQLRRMLDEQTLAENQRVRALCAEIKQLAFEHSQHPPEGAFFVLETAPDISVIMDRPLWSPGLNTKVDAPDLLVGEEDDLSALQALYAQFYVDLDLLREQLARLLEKSPSVSLVEVLEHYPPGKGVAELLAYLQIADESPQHQIDTERYDEIALTLTDGTSKLRLRLPHIVYGHYRP